MNNYRKLNEEEIRQLIAHSCTADDWANIEVAQDFKTDYVTDENFDQLVERYRPQVETYANAMARIYRKPVKASYLYFFHVDEFVKI